MNTRFIRTFLLVHQAGSMAQAARILNVTHGTVAQQIAALEQQLGVTLLARAGKTVHVTEAGLRLLDAFQRILNEVDGLPDLANSNEIKGELRIGAGNSVLNSVLPDILSRLIRSYPDVNVVIQPGVSPDFYRNIENGELDAAIAIEAPYALPKTLAWTLLREEPFLLLAAAAHAGKDPVHLLRSLPFIRYDHATWSGKLIEQYLRTAGIAPAPRFELNAIESIALMVNQDLGVAIIPDSANLYKRDLKIVKIPLPEVSAPRRFGLVWSRKSSRIRLVQAFGEAALKEYRLLNRQQKSR